MKIRCIFGNVKDGNSLHAILYNGQHTDVFEMLMDNWNNPEWVTQYLKNNKSYLDRDFYGITIRAAANQIMDEVELLEETLLEICEEQQTIACYNLDMFFKPLWDSEYKIVDLKKEKASIKNRRIKKPFLRIYALRISQDIFIITGGAIKLTQTMQEHPDTAAELIRIEQVRNFLKANYIVTENDLIYYYDNNE